MPTRWLSLAIKSSSELKQRSDPGPAKSASGGHNQAFDFSQGLEDLGSMAAMVGIGEIGGTAEEISDRLRNGRESLRLPW